MAKSTAKIRLNKKHQGKEFNSFFHFVGQVKRHEKFSDGQMYVKDFFEENKTASGKPRRVLQFDLLTSKHNNLKIELNGMERDVAYITSSSEKKNGNQNATVAIAWKDRFDKSKYPNDTYHLIDTEWDKVLLLAENLEEGQWVEVKGKYEFDSFTNDEGKTFLFVKRMVNSIEPVTNGQEIKLPEKKVVNYVTDFESEEFKEVNYFNLQIGILSTYQDETTKNTKVNGVFLAYGKERSTPKDVELVVNYKEPEDGKKSLADAFSTLNRYDFVEVYGIDNNRPEFSEVEEVETDEEDPFSDVSETTTRTNFVISGNKRGLEITSVLKGSLMKGLLTEEEITKAVTIETANPFNEGMPIDISEDDLPF